MDDPSITNPATDRSAERRQLLRAISAVALAPLWPARALRAAPRVTHDFEPVRAAIRSAIRSGAATGIAVAVVHAGRIAWEEGFGWANREAAVKVTAHTPFSLASLSKPFTTTAVTTLAAAGKLSLDAAAAQHLDERAIRGIGAERATIRQLGAHAAGLPSMFEMFPVETGQTAPSVSSLLLTHGELAYAPGSLYEYSNIGYAALGAIASRAAGDAFGTFVTQSVIEPLGMHDSFFDTNTSGLSRAAARYDELDRPIPFYTTATPPSGEVYASAHDLALFATFNLKTLIEGRRPILSDRWIDELHRPVLRGASAGATTFGWFSGATKSGVRVLFKDGGQPGVSTIMYLVPSEQLACLVLANRTDNGNLAQTLVDQMAATVLPDWTPPDIRLTAPTLPFSATAGYFGTWGGRLRGDADVGITLDIAGDSSATLSLEGQPAKASATLAFEGAALTVKASGRINSPEVMRNGATALSLKLLRTDRALAGRLLASAAGPGRLATIPFVLSLERRS